MFSWSSCVALFLGLELDGYVKNFLGFYLMEGEPYMNSIHGMMVSYWDGTVQYTLTLSGIALFTKQ